VSSQREVVGRAPVLVALMSRQQADGVPWIGLPGRDQLIAEV